MPAGAVYVGRPTVFGNPWTKGDAEYWLTPAADWRKWVVDRYDAELTERGGTGELEFVTVEQIRERLRGKDLACWCPLGAACHADVLLRIANEEPAVNDETR
jgi:hypothetical protein